MSVPDSYTTIGTQELQRSRYSNTGDPDLYNPLRIKLRSHNATKPSSSTPDSVGFDLYSAESNPITIPPNGEITAVSADITIETPRGSYARIAPQSSLAFKYNIDITAGVIDPDYWGNIKIGL